ncbi:MAG: serine hydrolase [Caulobacteraceae bacterium]|nr:serine hydrolase [Caulobacteraceae bacterium]
MPSSVDRRTLLLAVLGTSLANSHDALAAADPVSELGDLMSHRIVRQQAARGAVAGLLDRRRRRVLSARDAAYAAEYPLGGDTVFEIASLTKIFTALLLADAVVAGRAKFDDPLSDHVPAGVEAPSFRGRPIRLIDLATHGAALPLRPNNLANPAPDAPDKYAGYTLTQLYDGLPNYRLEREPGSRFEYSNLGFALLGQALAFRAGRPYRELLQERVTGPLGLRDTVMTDEPRLAGRRARGHDFYLDPVGPAGDGAIAPAYGLRSTADDLLVLLDLFLNDRGPPALKAAARLMLSVDRPGDDDATRMALGWRRTTRHGQTYYWSNGSGDGSRNFMGFNPARRKGVVILADAASGAGLDDIGRRWLDPAQTVDMTIIPRPTFIDLPEPLLLRAVGDYEYEPGDAFRVSRGATGLIVTMANGQFVIRPVSPTRYASIMGPGILLEFEGADTGPARDLVLHQDGATYVYRRTR